MKKLALALFITCTTQLLICMMPTPQIVLDQYRRESTREIDQLILDTLKRELTRLEAQKETFRSPLPHLRQDSKRDIKIELLKERIFMLEAMAQKPATSKQ